MGEELHDTRTPESITENVSWGISEKPDCTKTPESTNDLVVSKDVADKLMIHCNDPVNHPTHYTSGTIECIDFIDSCGYGFDFCLANAIKYLTRCKLKGTPEQDIRKAIWYATHAADGLKDGKYKLNE